MRDSVRVDFHLHSDLSDGYFTPEVLADKAAAAGVLFAALTDHHTLNGIERFRRAFERRGGVAIAGVELSTFFEGAEYHVLAFGFDPEHAGLRAMARRPADFGAMVGAVHDAGGIVYLAHPLVSCPERERLERIIPLMKAAGLDGIEAVMPGDTPDATEYLLEHADRLGLLVSAGSDFHGPAHPRIAAPGVDLDASRWARFRNVLPPFRGNGAGRSGPDRSAKTPPDDLKWFLLHIITPSLIAVALFLTVIFGVILPAFQENLLARKREMIRELTNSAWSVLAEYEAESGNNTMSRQEAQQAAIARIRHLRYGVEGKDYFWITDTHPRMIMHPYRTDLEGKDLSAFADPAGVRLFVEFTRVVRDREHGYVDYVWQWKDDPDRFEPKESYVRGFAPWGWIIGTGIYMEDVQAEIGAITLRLVVISIIISLAIGLLLFYIAHQSLDTDRRRRLAEKSLRESRERYRALSEASTEGTLMVLDGRCTYANRTFLEMSGYAREELPLLVLDDLFAALDEARNPAGRITIPESGELPAHFEAALRVKNRRHQEVLIAPTRIESGGRKGLILVAKNIGLQEEPPGRYDETKQRMIAQSQASVLFLNEPVSRYMQPVITCSSDRSITQAAEALSESGQGAIGVIATERNVIGIATNSDFRERVLARKIEPSRPVSAIMSAPVVAIRETALVHDALLVMQEKGVRHLLIRDSQGAAVGMISNTALMRFPLYSPVAVIQEIQRAETVPQVARAQKRLSDLVRVMVESGSHSRNVTHVISSVASTVAHRLIENAVREIGPPPARFAFIVFGSAGREEQTLVTDQDNAILYEDVPEESAAAASAYFLDLARRVCGDLDAAGYTYCKGESMAVNPRWNQPLSSWKNTFTKWIQEPGAEELLRFSILFDFRVAYGEETLADGLRSHIFNLLERTPSFLFHLARNTLEFKVPIGIFGQIVTAAAGPQPHTLNLKESLLPIVNFARLYALRYQVDSTNTISRLRGLVDKGVISRDGYNEMIQAHDFLMQLRYRHQVESLEQGRMPDNGIDPKKLTQIELSMLKQTFNQVSVIQKKIEFDFPGAG